jgi:hypothetical protein
MMKKSLLILKKKTAQPYLIDGNPLAMRIIKATSEASRTFPRFPTIASWTSASMLMLLSQSFYAIEMRE